MSNGNAKTEDPRVYARFGNGYCTKMRKLIAERLEAKGELRILSKKEVEEMLGFLAPDGDSALAGATFAPEIVDAAQDRVSADEEPVEAVTE